LTINSDPFIRNEFFILVLFKWQNLKSERRKSAFIKIKVSPTQPVQNQIVIDTMLTWKQKKVLSWKILTIIKFTLKDKFLKTSKIWPSLNSSAMENFHKKCHKFTAIANLREKLTLSLLKRCKFRDAKRLKDYFYNLNTTEKKSFQI